MDETACGQVLPLPGDAKHIPLVLAAPTMQLSLFACFVSLRGLTLNTSERSRSLVQTWVMHSLAVMGTRSGQHCLAVVRMRCGQPCLQLVPGFPAACRMVSDVVNQLSLSNAAGWGAVTGFGAGATPARLCSG